MNALFAPYEPAFENPAGPFAGEVRTATRDDAPWMPACQFTDGEGILFQTPLEMTKR